MFNQPFVINTYIPTFETVKTGHFIHFATNEGPTVVGTEGKSFEF